LPIKKFASRTEIVDLLIKKSPLWKNFNIMKLTENMRADPNEKEFAKQLLEIGNGNAGVDGYIKLPDSCICQGDLVDEIFGDIIQSKNYSDLTDRAILSPINTTVDQYNRQVMEVFSGDYHNFQSVDETDPNSNFPVSAEILNSSKCPSLPDHNLQLKKDCVVMLLRNLNVREGLCNGTRLQVVDPGKHVLRCIIMNGDRTGETTFIPRITLIEDKEFPYRIHRHQFPVRPAFAFTINKSQSQTFKKIGIDFRDDIFTHGQTYVALSRAKSWNGIKVKLNEENVEKKIQNIVWPEVL
jgi:heterodisulfide reductase subunit C